MIQNPQHEIVLIVQAMQLPVIFLMILFTFRAILSSRKGEKIYTPSYVRVTPFGKFIAQNPFAFVGVGLCFNLVYLMLKMQVRVHPGLVDADIVKHLSMVSDVIITICYVLYPIFDRASYSSGAPQKNNTSALLSIALLTSLGIFTLILNWSHKTIAFNVFNCIGYLILAVHIRRRLRPVAARHSSESSSYFVFLGFFGWGLLQLLVPISSFFEVDPERIELIGFSASTLFKIIILYGLYDLVTKIAELATIRRDQYNRRLQQVINNVSNARTTGELASNVVDHLTQSRLFDFSYCIFYGVDEMRERINFIQAKSLNPTIVGMDHWIPPDGVALDDRHVLARSYQLKKDVVVFGHFVESKMVNPEDPLSPLLPEAFRKYNQENLHRRFIPVLSAQETNTETSEVLAIVEVGFSFNESRFNDRMYSADSELNIYLDNCAQALERLKMSELKEAIESMLTRIDDDSKDDHLRFLENSASASGTFLGTDVAAFCVFRKDQAHVTKRFQIVSQGLTRNQEQLLTSGIEQIQMVVSDTKHPAESAFYKLCARLGMASMAVRKAFDAKNSIGYLLLFSAKASHFRSSITNCLDRLVPDIASIYREKKFHQAVASLVVPDDAIPDAETNLRPVVTLLQEYFETDFTNISILNKAQEYSQHFCSSEFEEVWNSIGEFKINTKNKHTVGEYYRISLERDKPFGKNTKLWEYCKKNDIKSLVYKPIQTQHQTYGVVIVGFRSNVTDLTHEDETFFNLISVKTMIVIQINNLVNAFKEISDSFTRNDLKAVLQTITDSAMQLLNADPVILFKSANDTEVFLRDITYSTIQGFQVPSVVDVFKHQKERHVELAELILNDQSKFFNSRTEYAAYVKRKIQRNPVKAYDQDFWDREGIQSMATIRLTIKLGNRNRPVGVMFINYRTPMEFNRETKRLIETFAAFAAGGIANAQIFDRNRQFMHRNIRMAKPVLTEVLAHGALHDAVKPWKAIYSMYYNLLADNHRYRTKGITELLKDLSNMEEPIENLQKVFNNLETLYRPSIDLQLGVYDLSDIIRAQLDSMEHEFIQKHLKLKDHYSHQKVSANCDRALIGNVVFNILNNAYQAVDIRGTIEVHLNTTENNKAKIDIIDDGKGISDDIKEYILEPYITDKSEGSGLGLAMSNLTVIQHGGQITYASKKGHTRFSIILPL